MNSFMYQSAAFVAIPALATCFNVPLLRREVSGAAHSQILDYCVTENDEVEDLYDLLQDVKRDFPEIEGVSVGAIVSSYQRNRVESVCQRLGLQPLSYLWERDRNQLLDEIVDGGIDAILVKVAGAGLDPHKHLGRSLKELRPTLNRLHQKFGLDLCGEGGEYETLVLDMPSFHHKLVIQQSEIVLDDEDCSVGNLKILNCRIEAKVSVLSTSSSPSVQSSMSNMLPVDDIEIIAATKSKGSQSRRFCKAVSISLGLDGFGQSSFELAAPSQTVTAGMFNVRGHVHIGVRVHGHVV